MEGEADFAVLQVGERGAPLLEAPEYHRLGEGFLELLLDEPCHRARPHLRIVAVLGQPVAGSVAELEQHLLLGKHLAQKVDLFVDHHADDLFAEPAEVDDSVEAVTKLGGEGALDRLTSAADAFDAAIAQSDTTSEAINELLYTSERLLTRDEGLVGRNWYKHHIYAPGFYTGYGVKTIPGVREAIEQRDYEKVSEQIDIAADVLNRMADRIETLDGMVREES